MIQITPTAEHYFARLLNDQDEPGLGLRLCVSNPGTPAADCELTFAHPDEVPAGAKPQVLESFTLYIDADSVEWLDAAELDFVNSETGGQLNIRAPNIKGHAPDNQAPLEDRVNWVLKTEINPGVAAHGGNVSLIDITPKKEVVLQFGGGCHGCGMVNVTLKNGVEKTLLERVPEVTAVLDATDHSQGENPYFA